MNNNVNLNRPMNNQNFGQQPVIVPVMGQQVVPRPDVQPNVVVPRPNNLLNRQVIVEQPNQREVRLDIPLAQQGPSVNPNQVQHARVPSRGQVQENRRDGQLNRQPLSQQGQGGLFSQKK